MRMGEINRRYFDGLLADRQLSLRGLARQMHMSHSQLSLALNGHRKFQADEIVQISNIFGEPVTRVMDNAGLDVRSTAGRRVSVVGAGMGDGTIERYGQEVLERTTLPDELPDDVVALQWRTAGTPLDFLDGAVMFFREPHDIDPAALGRLAYVKIKDGPAVVCGLRRGYRAGTYNCFGFYRGESLEIEASSPILITRH